MGKYQLAPVGGRVASARTAINSTELRALTSLPAASPEVIHLAEVNLANPNNWVRALEDCMPNPDTQLEQLQSEIGSFQAQMDQALQSAQAQGTIYAYAIAKRLELIEDRQLYSPQHRTFTAFIDSKSICYPDGRAISPRSLWSYRRVGDGLEAIFELMHQIRSGQPSEQLGQIQRLQGQISLEMLQNLVHSQIDYAERVASILGLGTSKIDQLMRLERPITMISLLTGQLPPPDAADNPIPLAEMGVSELRKLVRQSTQKSRKSNPTSKRPQSEQQASPKQQSASTPRSATLNEVQATLDRLFEQPQNWSDEDRARLVGIQRSISNFMLKTKPTN